MPPRVVICIKIGDPRITNVPTDHQTADCSECGQAVWTSPQGAEIAEATGAKPICIECFQDAYPEVELPKVERRR